MTWAFAGAIALALAVTSAALAPAFRFPGRGPGWAHPDRRALDESGWRRAVARWECVRIVAIAAGALTSVALSAPPMVGAVAGAIAPSVLIHARADRNARRARTVTLRILRLVEGALRSGAGVAEAIRRATFGCDNPTAARPFASALRAFDLGAPLDDALRAAAASIADRRVRIPLETLALGVSSRLPAERAAVLVGAIADRMAFDERLDQEVRARTGGLRTQVVILAGLVPVLTVYLAATVPSLATTLTSPLGRAVLVPLAALLEVVGLVASDRLVTGARR